MVEGKIQLMITNSKEIDNVKGTFGMNLFKKCNSMNLAIKDLKINAQIVNECRTLIKNNTSIFSNFRGNNLLTTAVNLSVEPYPNKSLNETIEIYTNLKKQFFTSEFLVLAAGVIYRSKNKISIDEAIIKTRTAYDFMKKKHWILTNSQDISAAAMIATTSPDLEVTFRDIEECYKNLKNKGFWGGNNLQSLSHILSLNSLSTGEKCSKVLEIDKVLKSYGVALKGYSLPILGVAAFATDDFHDFAKKVTYTRDRLKKEKGFGSFSLGTLALNMISSALVASSYIDNIANNTQENLIENLNNTALTMVIAMQVAASTAAAGAAAAASSSSN